MFLPGHSWLVIEVGKFPIDGSLPPYFNPDGLGVGLGLRVAPEIPTFGHSQAR